MKSPHPLDDLDATTREQLLAHRAQIDAFDDQLIALLKERSEVVRRVGALKKHSYDPACYIRPAREAEMLRDIVGRFTAEEFPAIAAASLWRTIIAASTALESPFTFSVLADEATPALYWLTREYFGSFSPVLPQKHAKLVLSDLLEGKATVGILPMPSDDPENDWWQLLSDTTSTPLQIFACLPFVITPHDLFDAPPAVAVARLRPEPTGDDRTLLALHADEGISQQRLSAFFTDRHAPRDWLRITPPQAGKRTHLLAIKRFVDAEDALITALRTELNAQPVLLGSYATPLKIT